MRALLIFLPVAACSLMFDSPSDAPGDGGQVLIGDSAPSVSDGTQDADNLDSGSVGPAKSDGGATICGAYNSNCGPVACNGGVGNCCAFNESMSTSCTVLCQNLGMVCNAAFVNSDQTCNIDELSTCDTVLWTPLCYCRIKVILPPEL